MCNVSTKYSKPSYTASLENNCSIKTIISNQNHKNYKICLFKQGQIATKSKMDAINFKNNNKKKLMNGSWQLTLWKYFQKF